MFNVDITNMYSAIFRDFFVSCTSTRFNWFFIVSLTDRISVIFLQRKLECCTVLVYALQCKFPSVRGRPSHSLFCFVLFLFRYLPAFTVESIYLRRQLVTSVNILRLFSRVRGATLVALKVSSRDQSQRLLSFL